MSDYEVLLRRDNGMNKTVIIHDCYSDQEAADTAEAMYGMEVLRVMWLGKTNNDSNSSESVSYSSGSSSDIGGFFGAIVGLFFLILIVQFWKIALVIGAILLILYVIGASDD